MRKETGKPAHTGAPGGQRGDGPSIATYLGLGLQFVVAVLVFLYIGQWLDRRLGTEPWLMMAGVFLGAAAAILAMYRMLTAEQRREEERRR